MAHTRVPENDVVLNLGSPKVLGHLDRAPQQLNDVEPKYGCREQTDG